jgi:hypothetical protein
MGELDFCPTALRSNFAEASVRNRTLELGARNAELGLPLRSCSKWLFAVIDRPVSGKSLLIYVH